MTDTIYIIVQATGNTEKSKNKMSCLSKYVLYLFFISISKLVTGKI